MNLFRLSRKKDLSSLLAEAIRSPECQNALRDVICEVMRSPDIWNLHVRAGRHIWGEIQTDTAGVMRLESSKRSAEYVRANIPLHFQKTALALRADALRDAPADGLFLEFGVWKAYWINECAKVRPDVTFYGFDSFRGLKEPWEFLDKGAFDLGGELPPVEKNVRLVAGWFDETVGPFLAEHPEPVSFVHIDCDTYESTKVVMDALASRLRPGSRLVLDDAFVAPNWEKAEFAAVMEGLQSRGIKFDWTGWCGQTPGCSASLIVTAV